jgi:PIN domain nuclease of toxin-antitoxin system
VTSEVANQVWLAVASSWEMAIQYAAGKLPLPEEPGEFVPKRLMRDGVETLAVEHRHALEVSRLPLHHHDPFDRLLIALGRLEKIPIATVDPKFEKYEVKLVG